MDHVTAFQVHGWLMWASFGFLFPLGVLLIRYKKNKRVFYVHIGVQVVAVALAIVGIAILLYKLGPNWNFTHQRLGLALFIIALGLLVIGKCRPEKGTQYRPYWFMLHWGLGTSLLFLGIVNCYIGINGYQHITKRSLRSLNIAFSIQVSVMALLWVLQDRWTYIWSGATVASTHNNIGKVAEVREDDMV